jgi:hypothetical protein
VAIPSISTVIRKMIFFSRETIYLAMLNKKQHNCLGLGFVPGLRISYLDAQPETADTDKDFAKGRLWILLFGVAGALSIGRNCNRFPHHLPCLFYIHASGEAIAALKMN